MEKLLKGNYKVKSKKIKNTRNNKSYSRIFESKALEKLGGSIAFVMKSNKFIWTGNEEA